MEVWCRCSVGSKKSDLEKELRVLIAAGALLYFIKYTTGLDIMNNFGTEVVSYLDSWALLK